MNQDTDMTERCRVATYYDGGCPLCAKEIAHYQALDQNKRVEWIDITSAAQALASAQLNFNDAMALLHVRDRNGRMQTGAYAFAALWRELPGWRYLARLTRLPLALPVMDRAYRIFAARRLRLTGRATAARPVLPEQDESP